MKVITLVVSLLVVSMLSLDTQVAEKGYGKEVGTTVMSYNIHHGVGIDGELSLNRIADVIRDSGAEIVGLQEVDRFYGARSDFKDQAKELASLLGYHYAYGANLDLESGEGQTNNRQYGTAILSKYPILHSENILLSSFGKEQRGVLHAVVNVRGIHVDVYNTHLGLDVPSRMAQIQEIIDLASASNGPALLTGDFNAEPDSEEIQLLLDNGLFVNSFQGIDDAYTFPVFNPSEIIDYILTSPAVQHANQRVIHAEASDHLPITTDVIFKR
ncbi:Metal-dependent hydrolase, endonuclease/exonuclease/phosphatase family [Paenibacillus uliginis N3/975]|uniref:Metal-dependent hydrolase, endonuclease/exonuclease/phosphatase family n=1 Tax=Paenibacillus uliginis N3/975 TaxID=1313296 RepID=A0A1X7HUZ2_9BACL|nr:endonuclease/exonuclease/phosphatase family protein [Paenibacillus uliginis]SMF92590.1 Metal-dependent hydrolase, endonuclease/exonuclease/phosphatase family [Paenibacillus uliginis N3/975]